MFITTEDLPKLAGKVAMVDGCFDPLHPGHLDYFRAAADLGFPLLCSVTGDDYLSAKHIPLLTQAERARLLEQLKPIEYVYVNPGSTEDALRLLVPALYVKGNDWEGRLPEHQVAICRELDIGIRYLDTVRGSSTGILERFLRRAGNDFAAQVDEFEATTLAQVSAPSDHYNQAYFHDQWREGANDYTVETRRKIEGRNPELIRDVFQPERVVDMGCGPGALMYLLHELGVEVAGVDFSPESKRIAPVEVRDRIHIGSVFEPVFPSDSFDLVICREVLEHLTTIEVQRAVQNLVRTSSKFIYLTTRFHPSPKGLLEITTEFEVDPTHITLLNKEFLRALFVLAGCRTRRDLENRMDWLGKGRVLVFEKIRANS